MSLVPSIREHLKQLASTSTPITAVFFKTGPGEYSEHDQFIGLRTPLLRQTMRVFTDVPLRDIEELLSSPINEERMLALLMLVRLYKKDSNAVYRAYRQNMHHVNNWNLVDASAHHIVGAYTWQHQELDVLAQLAASTNLWEKRIAIVATWHTIGLGQSEWTTHIATQLLGDSHDLIHKAVGWMLREMGKKEMGALEAFLAKHAPTMPRTMLRYAIEKLSPEQRRMWMNVT